MSSVIRLFDLVNLSIGIPDTGCVDFSALHTLLHAIITRLNIQDATTQWIHEDPRGHGPTEQQLSPDVESRVSHHMESKLRDIESKLALLEKLPSGADLIACTSTRVSPVNDMWQIMQLRRRVEANEDGVSKAMALIQDLMKEISELQASRNHLQEEVRTLQGRLSQLNMNELLGKVKVLEQCCHQVEDLEKVLREVQESVRMYPDPEELTHFITWDVLQDTLVREDQQLLEPHARLPHRLNVGVEHYPETVNALRHVGQLKKNHDFLEERVAQVEKDKAERSELQPLRDHITGIANQNAHDDLLEQLNYLKGLVDGLMTDRMKNSELIGIAQGAMWKLEEESKKLGDTVCHLVEDRAQMQTNMDQMHKSLNHLEEKKADRDLVEMKIDIKADKRALESKVSRTQFDTMTEQLSSMFHELLGKVTGQEQDWQNVVEKISAEMESKLNRIELDPLKAQLEERWKAIRTQLQAQPMLELDDAAGFRKQLVARFHCISCDRPVDMLTPGPQLISIPCAPGLPSHKSNRPYTVYELEQVRQHCRSERIPEMADYSYLPVSRNCGGSHTLSLANRRYTHLQHIAHFMQSSPEAQSSPRPTLPAQVGVVPSMTRALSPLFLFTSWSQAKASQISCRTRYFFVCVSFCQAEEVDILGLNGQVYKGRLTTRTVKNMDPGLPTIIPKEVTGTCRGRENVTRLQSQKLNLVKGTSRTMARPHSARTYRSQSALSCSGKGRPTSSSARLSHTTVSESTLPVDNANEIQQRLEIHMDHLQIQEGEVTGGKCT
ncbi:glutamine-rich protein 2-like isoform X3 [Brienomyrus brachyistius]|uniref:glutamine-rich protein 2-like isoform X3 n=1 Tax=Brienomyrus brachyistius TaxID=42636 RepID=UPI0020B2A169|nr:glutamine-rich protein 2-like isoform X3 [Brienomyrus brachyistius]